MVIAALQGRCRWCNGRCAMVCASCGQGVHFSGQCDMWNMGACWSFSPHAAEDNLFCPDCAWAFIRVSVSTHRQMVDAPALGDGALEAHMAVVASLCKEGAGHAAATVPVPWSVRAARRWLVRYLEHKNWTCRRRVLAAACAHAASHDLSFAPVACRRALDGLTHDGKVVTRSAGQVIHVHRACRHGPGEFIVHEHSRRRRRRRDQQTDDVGVRRVRRRSTWVLFVSGLQTSLY